MGSIRHIALIPDGNRRWARAHGKSVADGHRAGIAAMTGALSTCFDSGAETASFWWSSPANLTRRDPEEVRRIVGVLAQWLHTDLPQLLAQYDANFVALGRWRALCPELIGPIDNVAGKGGKRTIALLMAYDGRDEIRAAADALGGGGDSREAFERALWTGGLGPVDLLVRTGDSTHLSAAFMAWQASEARLYFAREMWPAITPARLAEIIAQAGGVERRYGA